MPGIKATVPIVGGRTLVEILCMLGLILIAAALALPDNKGAGRYSDFFGAATTILGLRNNLLQVIFGISYERALHWHRVMGCCTLAMIIFHALCGFSFSGFMICFAVGAMLLTYFIKNVNTPRAFEIFYYTHLASVMVIIVFGLMHHSAMWFSLSGFLWMLDVIARSFITGKTLKATATSLPGDIIRLTFDKPIKYEPGQYAFIRIPAVNIVEYHPFSFSSSPQQDQMVMHVRELGDWTRRLGDLARAHTGDAPLSLEVMMDGPYGNFQVNVLDPDYQVFVLISGGIGITPNQSLYNSLVTEVEAGRSLRKVLFLWCVKDRAIVNSMTPAILSSKKLQDPDMTPLSFQPAMVGRPPDNLNVTNVMSVTDSEGGGGVEMNVATAEHDQRNGDIESSTQHALSSQIFENRFYLTQVRAEDHFQEANIRPEQQPWLHFGRPDLAKTFEEVCLMLQSPEGYPSASCCRQIQIPRVCVSVCGPAVMVQQVQELCRQSKLGCSNVIFDCHAEVFDL